MAPLLGYTALSFIYFGARVVPHPGRDYVGTGIDPTIFVWSVGWWPHALLHGQSPFVSHVIWAPAGVNLAWTTSVPGLALLLSPVTLAFGPVVAYNVGAVAFPALAAWTGYLLCRYVTGSTWAALVGGYLFGFSSYVLGQELGHLHVSAVFLLPLVALVILRYLHAELAPGDLVMRLGPLLAAELYISTEVSLSLAIALTATLVIARLTRTGLRLLPTARAIAYSYGLALVLAAPLIAYALSGFESRSVNLPAEWNTDAANFLVPTDLTLVSTRWTRQFAMHFTGNDFERGAYLGLPTLIIILWFAVLYRRRRSTRFLVASFLLAVLCALGTDVVWHGKAVTSLPWGQIARLPAFDNLLTARFTVYTSLLAAVMVSLWLASSRVALVVRVALAALAVIAILPRFTHGLWYTHPSQPAFFARDLARRCLAAVDRVIVLPYTSNGPAMLWQAESGFDFTMAGGYVRPKPPPMYERYPAVSTLDENDPPPHGLSDLLTFTNSAGVSAIVVDDAAADRWQTLLSPLGQPIEYGGVRLYRLEGVTPATCGLPA